MSGKQDEFKLLKWHGAKVFQCRLCAFNSTDQKRFEDHYRRVHPPVRIIDGGKAQEPDKPVKEASNGNASS